MAGFSDLRDYVQAHPKSLATGLVIAVPASYFLVAGAPESYTLSGFYELAPSSFHLPPFVEVTPRLSVYMNTFRSRLGLPISEWGAKHAPNMLLHALQTFQTASKISVVLLKETRGHFVSTLESLLRQAGASQVLTESIRRSVSAGLIAAIPATFLFLTYQRLDSRGAKSRTQFVYVLLLIALATVANRTLSTQDLLIAVLFLMSVEALRRSLSRGSATTCTEAGKKLGRLRALPSAASMESRNRLATGDSDTSSGDPNGSISSDGHHISLRQPTTDAQYQDSEIEHIYDTLRLSRSSLNDPSAENAHLREELKSIKKIIGRDHQGALYKRELDLFESKKSYELKKKFVDERETALDNIYRQYREALEQKDAHIRALEHRIASSTHTQTRLPENVALRDSTDEHQAAVQVKLLHIKGRKSQEQDRDEEKDVEIAKLKEDIAALQSGSENYTRLQEELRRAWDAAHETENMLNQERRNHKHTINKLQETTVRLEEEIRKSQKSSPARLPTIQESDKQELESMFNAAQQDNLRLYTELETVEKRLRDTNQRLLTVQQELEAVKEQLRLEKAINADMENAGPSAFKVHRLRQYTIQGQLKEANEALKLREEEIQQLKATVISKENQVAKLKTVMDADKHARTVLEAELDRVKKAVVELEATKEQLMLDHERLARHRSRNIKEIEKDHESARFSGATLFTDPNNPPTTTAARPEPEPPLPVRPDFPGDTSTHASTDTPAQASTPEPAPRAISEQRKASEGPNRADTISTLVPASEKQTRRKSLTLKGIMRKMAGKDAKEGGKSDRNASDKHISHPRAPLALAPKDKNAPIRPQTSATATQTRITGISKDTGGANARPKTIASQTAFAQGQQQIALERAKSANQKREPLRDADGALLRPRSAVYTAKSLNMNVDGQADGTETDTIKQKPHLKPAFGDDEKEKVHAPLALRPTTAGSGQSRQARLPTIRVWSGSGNS